MAGEETGAYSKKVYILLMNLPAFSSGLIRLATFFPYAHTTIGLQEDMNTFYSFVHRGFMVERLSLFAKNQRKPSPCILYEFDVTEQSYEKVKAGINSFVKRRKELHYSYLNVAFSILHIPNHRKNHYYCSQFAAQMLEEGQVTRLKKDSSLYFPRDFTKLPDAAVKFKGTLQELVAEFSLDKAPSKRKTA